MEIVELTGINMNEKKYDLEERLIDFAVAIINLTENLPNTRSGNHLGGQLLRSGTSPSLNSSFFIRLFKCSYFKKD